MLALLLDRILDAHIRRLPNFCSVLLLIGLLYTFCFFLVLPTYYSGQIERIATEKDNDGSLGQRAVTLDTNFTKMIINELQNTESRKRLVSTLSLYEKIKMNELLQGATFEDRYKMLPGEERTEQWTQHLRALLVNERNKTPQNLLKFVIERQIKGTGNGTVLLVGNSHADVISRELEEEMNGQYNKLQMFTMPGCMPISMPEHFITFDPGHIIPCPFYTRTVKKIVEQAKPDVLFLVFRWYDELLNVQLNENGTKNDEILNAFRHELRHFQKYAKHIFISAPTLQYKHVVAKELAKRLWQHAALGDLHLSRQEHYTANRFSYERLRLLECPKCELFDLADHFCDQKVDKCWAFDEQTQLAYFFDNNHLSYLGRQAIRPYLRTIINKMVVH
uniref:SGNH domain-containing protein n=1 Tax=Globodera rostochiensis TaxID=31243 RepID=A0A914HMJ7_GLORO